MNLRRASQDDLDALAAIFLAARAEMTYLPTETLARVRPWLRDHVLPDCEVFVALATESPVAFIALEDDAIEHLYVHPAQQSRGIGSRLLVLAKERWPQGLSLYVFEPNMGAIRFYERHGFTTVGRSDGTRNEERVPDRRMTWRP